MREGKERGFTLKVRSKMILLDTFDMPKNVDKVLFGAKPERKIVNDPGSVRPKHESVFHTL